MGKIKTINLQKQIAPSELIINPDESIYHLHLLPDDIADDIIIVGDQGRVDLVASFFDKIEIKKQNREFYTCTGYFKNKRISVLSTGIGTDNIDIVLNELDALVNINFKEKTKKLNIIRIGTSGSLQKDIPVDTFVINKYGLALDGVIKHSSNEKEILNSLNNFKINPLYLSTVSKDNSSSTYSGITATANGFYGPQGRILRLEPKINSFEFNGLKITNYEMETSAFYAIRESLGHNCVTICAIIANRFNNKKNGY